MKIVEKERYEGTVLGINGNISSNRYIKCEFDKCKLSYFKFINCEFEDCIFTNCDFSKSFLALNKNYESGKFIRCLFVICNLAETNFNFPIIDKCEFRNCILKETNFDGSRFSNTKFIGELDSCFFRGYSIYAGRGTLFSFSGFDSSNKPNKMVNVDFSASILNGVSFTNRIDLSNCIFPKGDYYIYIQNLKKTIERVTQIINEEWADGYEKDTATKLIDLVYYNKDLKEQQNSFIDSFIIKAVGKEEDDQGVGMKIFNLIRSLQ